MHAYAVQRQRGMVKLDAMENPYRLPAGAAARARRSGSARVALNRYPDAAAPTRCKARWRAMPGMPARLRRRCSATARTS